MAQSTTTWRNGQSGNPKGRPPMRARPLATVLREIGAKENAERENRTAVATLIWGALRTGRLALDNDKQLDLTAKEWLDLVKWVHLHIDGGLERKSQYAEASDQASQLEEGLQECHQPDPDPVPAPADASDPASEPVLHTLS